MTLKDLIDQFRNRSGDTQADYAFSDALLTGFANQAETEAAIRSKLLYDTQDKAIASGTSLYTLDDYIFKIDSAVLTDAAGVKTTLTLVDRVTLDKRLPLWREATAAIPQYLITEEAKFELTPTPAAAYTLSLYYYRTPLYPMYGLSDSPEINPRHHDGLVDWMVRQALQERDIDFGNLNLSADAEAKFIRRFGIREDANVLRKQARKGAHTTRAIGF